MRWAPTATATGHSWRKIFYFFFCSGFPTQIGLRQPFKMGNTFWYSNLMDRMVLMMVPLWLLPHFCEKKIKTMPRISTVFGTVMLCLCALHLHVLLIYYYFYSKKKFIITFFHLLHVLFSRQVIKNVAKQNLYFL